MPELSGDSSFSLPTDRAREAKKILSLNNIFIDIIKEKEQTLFSAEDIGKATLEQQNQTSEKIAEENSRIANQITRDSIERE